MLDFSPLEIMVLGGLGVLAVIGFFVNRSETKKHPR